MNYLLYLTNKFITNEKVLTYKDIDLLRNFINNQSRILPRRLTKLSAREQKQITKAIKQARILALLPFINYK
uniref:Ribosomal protein S18 n=1 Tax=Apophlaea sinclairii TaxID=212746 RepID=A0A1C9CBJ4_9FLOR|nr:ribosomal protein S18 [Apophlaea sinclairii]AOM65724.1 ribosomal protein S18 [Apophlaea sinclairii]